MQKKITFEYSFTETQETKTEKNFCTITSKNKNNLNHHGQRWNEATIDLKSPPGSFQLELVMTNTWRCYHGDDECESLAFRCEDCLNFNESAMFY